MPRSVIATFALLVLTVATHAAPAVRRIAVENGEGLELVHLVPAPVTYRGHKALKLVAPAGAFSGDEVALVKDLDFKDGTIEVDLAGLPGPGADPTARGFVGVAFRSAPHASQLECFYLRPTNGRADDQLRRNHSAQYVSDPEFPWQKLRTETPGVYESYVDLESGAWTHVRIDVKGVSARLFVNGATQPTLLVKDLKRGDISGAIGLWIGPGTEAYFRDLRVTTDR